jgi:hypothetical protein
MGTYSSINVSYVGGNYQIELWLRYSEFDGYGPFTLYFMLNKTNYHNQTQTLDINILGLSIFQIDNPISDETFYSNETLTIELSYDDFIKGVPIIGAVIQWKVGLMGTYSNINVSYASGNYQIELWLRHSLFDGFGPFTLYFLLNKTHYYNQTGSLNVNLIGLTSINIINITQYNQSISLNGSIYEAQAGANLTLFANFINDYPHKIITNAIGILTFNGEDYISLGGTNGIYGWEINTISLVFGVYDFNITFIKENYENITKVYNFRINNLIAKIEALEKPISVKQGASFSLSLKLYYELYDEYSISNANLSIRIDFGTSTSFQYLFTNASGMSSFEINVPTNALIINITAYYPGNGTYTSASLEISDIVLIPLQDDDSFPLLPLIVLSAAIFSILAGAIFIRSRSKKKKASIKAEVSQKQKPDHKQVGKNIEPMENSDKGIKSTSTESSKQNSQDNNKENENQTLDEVPTENQNNNVEKRDATVSIEDKSETTEDSTN